MRVVTAVGHPPRVWAATLAGLPPLRLPRRLTGIRILVAAAHADDETLGAAGLIMSARRRGADVVLVICTDGAAAFPEAGPRQRRQLAALRRQESLRAAAVLGVPADAVHHLELPDGQADDHGREIADRLADLGAACAWWAAPWRLDPHPDHRAVGRAAAQVLPAGAGLLEYPVWMRHGLTPRQVNDRDRRDLRVLRLHRGLRARKQLAVASHASQIRVHDPSWPPVLPGYVLAHFRDGLEPFFVTAPNRGRLTIGYGPRPEADGAPNHVPHGGARE